MFRRVFLSLAMLGFVSGCIEVPELEEAVSNEAEKAEAPKLLPIGPATAPTSEPRLDGSEAEVLSRRAEALKAEASRAGSPGNAADLDEKARLLSQRAEDLRNR